MERLAKTKKLVPVCYESGLMLRAANIGLKEMVAKVEKSKKSFNRKAKSQDERLEKAKKIVSEYREEELYTFFKVFDDIQDFLPFKAYQQNYDEDGGVSRFIEETGDELNNWLRRLVQFQKKFESYTK